jgi:hypothetical protein
MAVPMLTYASENWTKNRSHKRKTDSAVIRLLRSVDAYSKRDQRRSIATRSELKIFNLTDTIEKQKGN